MAFHFGEVLTYDHVLEILGAVDTGVFSEIFHAVVENRTTDCIRKLEDMVIQGRELGQFVVDFVWYMRNLLLVQTTDDPEGIVDASAENIKLLTEDAALTDGETLMRYIRVFSELSNQLRYASQKRVLIELAFIKLTRPEMEQNLDSIIQRLNRIEEQLEEGIPVNPASLQAATAASPAAETPALADSQEPPQQVPIPKAQLEDLNLIRNECSADSPFFLHAGDEQLRSQNT